MKDSIVVNGVPCVMSLSLVTEPGEGWRGERFIGGPYESMAELNEAINRTVVPEYWQLKVEFQDKY